jgi:hypothetical protein
MGIWSSPDFQHVRVRAPDGGRVRTSLFAGLDPVLVLAIAGLGAMGVLNLQSLGDTQAAVHQAACVALGLVAMMVAARIGAAHWKWLAFAIYGGALALLAGGCSSHCQSLRYRSS